MDILSSTDIKWDDLEELEGWISDYLAVVRGTRFPPAFHLLCGLYALSSVIGRRGKLIRPGYSLYPPLWIFLLGSSGTGKSSALEAAQQVLLGAQGKCPALLVEWLGNFTASSLLTIFNKEEYRRSQFEGTIIVEEAASLFGSIVGNDANAAFLLNASKMGSPKYWTSAHGDRTIPDFTLGLGFASTISSLVKAGMTGDSFGDGLMHRFIIVHGRAKGYLAKDGVNEYDYDIETLHHLGQLAVKIREGTPLGQTQIAPDAHRRLQNIAKQKEEAGVRSMNLTGLVNRISGTTARIALILARSRRSTTLELRDVEQALPLVEKIVSPISEIITDLDMSSGKRSLVMRSYDLWHNLEKGMTEVEFRRTLPAITIRKQNDEFNFLDKMGYIHKGTRSHQAHVWGEHGWVEHT